VLRRRPRQDSGSGGSRRRAAPCTRTSRSRAAARARCRRAGGAHCLHGAWVSVSQARERGGGDAQMAMNEHGPFRFCVMIFVLRPRNSTSFRYHSSSYVSLAGRDAVVMRVWGKNCDRAECAGDCHLVCRAPSLTIECRHDIIVQKRMRLATWYTLVHFLLTKSSSSPCPIPSRTLKPRSYRRMAYGSSLPVNIRWSIGGL
jgi:hypothetical protein